MDVPDLAVLAAGPTTPADLRVTLTDRQDRHLRRTGVLERPHHGVRVLSGDGDPEARAAAAGLLLPDGAAFSRRTAVEPDTESYGGAGSGCASWTPVSRRPRCRSRSWTGPDVRCTGPEDLLRRFGWTVMGFGLSEILGLSMAFELMVGEALSLDPKIRRRRW